MTGSSPRPPFRLRVAVTIRRETDMKEVQSHVYVTQDGRRCGVAEGGQMA